MIGPVTLPEIVLLETVEAALTFVRNDYALQVDKTKTYLYKLLNTTGLDNYKLYEQAVEVICGPIDSPRRFEIDLAYNMTRERMPSAHITLPGENTGQGNGMGMDENYAETDWTDEIANEVGQATNLDEDTGRAIYSRRITAVYNLVIMSDNSNEVVLLYHFLRAMLIALIPHLHEKRLSNISFGGNDLQPYADSPYHMRAITINMQYDTFVPSIYPFELVNKLQVVGTPVID